jgi:hypothetical protein
MTYLYRPIYKSFSRAVTLQRAYEAEHPYYIKYNYHSLKSGVTFGFTYVLNLVFSTIVEIID